MGDLTKDFSYSEFECECGCGLKRVDLEFVGLLQSVRSLYGYPMRITSGLRCQNHNKAVGGVVDSAHLRGFAADIACVDSTRRANLVSCAIDCGFTRIGIAKTFIHLDCDPSLPTPRIWVY